MSATRFPQPGDVAAERAAPESADPAAAKSCDCVAPASCPRCQAPPVRGGLLHRFLLLAAAGAALVRPANVVTAGADSIAGFLIAGGDLGGQWSTAVRLVFTSMALYAGGMALNDVADAREDAINRPERPIPSGAISRKAAGGLGGGLLALGMVLAASLGHRPGTVALACIAAILLYDLFVKSAAIGPVVMGLCRALNLALGMSAAAGGTLAPILPALILGVYVASLTLFARSESGWVRRDPLIVGSLGMTVAMATTCFLMSWEGWRVVPLLFVVMIAAVWVAWLGFRVVHGPRTDVVRDAVQRFVLGIVCLDALMVTSLRGPGAGLIVGAFLIPSVLIARRVRVS